MTEHLHQYPPPGDSLESIAANNPALAGTLTDQLGRLHHVEPPLSDVENWQPEPETHQSITHIEPPAELSAIAGISEELHQQDPAADHDTIMRRTEQAVFDRTITSLIEAHEPGATNEKKRIANDLVSTAYCLDALNRAHAGEDNATTNLSERITSAGYGTEVAQASQAARERGLLVRDHNNALQLVSDVIPVSIEPTVATNVEVQKNAEKQYITKKRLYVKDELRPIETKKFIGNNGVELDLPVLARFDTQDPDTKMVFTQYKHPDDTSENPGYMLTVVRQGKDDSYQVADYKDLDFNADVNQQLSIKDNQQRPLQTVFIEKGDERANYKWMFLGQKLDMATGMTSSVTTHLNASQDVSRRGRSGRELDSRRDRRIESLKGGLSVSKKILVGFIAIKAALGSGGLVDQIGEKFNDAQSVVYEAIPEPEHRIILPEDNWGDGIAYMHAPEGTLEAAQTKSDERYAAKVEAREAVAGLMEQLDSHDYEAIRTGAHDYLKDHPNDVLPREELQRIQESIDAAATNEDVLRAIAPFAEFYGIEVRFQTKVDKKYVDAFDPSSDVVLVKQTVSRIIDSLAWMPKELMEDAAMDTIEIGKSNASVLGGTAAVYSSGTRALRIPVRSSGISELTESAFGYIMSQDASQEGDIVHEFGHALGYGGSGLGSKVPEGRVITEEDERGGEAILSHMFWGNIVQMPQDISPHSRIDNGERTADNLSALLSERTDGIAHPDEWRRFNSPANKEFLRVLGRLEENHPGIAAYIIANNKNLMGYNGLDTLPTN